MAVESFDVVVVGSGPAGAAAAWALAREGASVMLVDRAEFPRYKVCGCCLNAATLTMLAQMGLSDRLRGAAIESFRCIAGGRHVTLRLPGGMAVARDALDMMLVNHAVEAGVRFLPGASASPGDVTADYRRVLLRRYGEVRARLVIAADGLAGSFTRQLSGLQPRAAKRSHIGAGIIVPRGQTPADYRPGVICMACGHGGYVGSVRLADGRLNVAAALDPQMIRQHESIGHAAAAILRESGCTPIDALLPGAWHGTPRLTHRCRRLGDHRLLVLGDAAGYVEPFTGEGIAWALASGLAVATVARHAAERWSARCVTQWSRMHRRSVRKRQLGCRVIAGLLRRPGCVSAGLALVSAAPQAARPILHWINAPLHTSPEAATT